MSEWLRSHRAGEGESHASPRELALYVIDALPRDRKEALEDHVAVCEPCAEGLAREAQVEAAFVLVAQRAEQPALAPVYAIAHPIAARKSGRWFGGVAGALAAAAALVLAFASATSRADSSPPLFENAAHVGAARDAADMSGAFASESLLGARDSLDGG